MTLYETLLVAHVLGVMVWFGGSVTMFVLWRRALASGDDSIVVSHAATARWFDLWIGLPAAIVVLLAGGWLMSEGNWGMDQGWLHIGMFGVFASEAITLFWSRRLFQRVIADRGVTALAGRISLGMTAALCVLLMSLWSMIVKPLA